MNNPSSEIEKHFGQIASLMGEKSRAIMLWNLLDGRAFTATELAMAADISVSSASNHLAQLLKGGLIRSDKQGRHKYFRFASDRVARAVENIAALMPEATANPSGHHTHLTGLKYARTCYDHLAGRLGVQLTQSLVKNRWLIAYEDRYEVSDRGYKQFGRLGIDLIVTQKQNRKFAYPCIDWSERSPHLGGALGAALLQSLKDHEWIRKTRHSREVVITGQGKAAMSSILKMVL